VETNSPFGNEPTLPTREHWVRRALLPASIVLSIGSFVTCPPFDNNYARLAYAAALCFVMSTSLAVLSLFSRWRELRKDESWFLLLLSAAFTIFAIILGALLILAALALAVGELKYRASH